MAEKVGGIYYEVTLDTSKMILQQREIERALGRTSGAAGAAGRGLQEAGGSAQGAGQRLGRLGDQAGAAGRGLQGAGDAAQRAGRGVDAASASVAGLGSQLTAVVGAIGVYATAMYLIQNSDAYTKFNAQLKLATESTRELAVAQAAVRQIAQEAAVNISGVGVLYARITQATKQLGTSQKEVGDLTRTVALSLAISGAATSESASAMLQLSQAFASGVLRGEEFNAVNEAAPRLMLALADGMGVPVGQLRAMAEQGEITSKVMAQALPKALKELEAEAAQIVTISGTWQQLNNEIMLFIGQQAKANGSASALVSVISMLASNLDLLTAAAIGYAGTRFASLLLHTAVAAHRKALHLIEATAAQRAATMADQASTAATLAETTAKLSQLSASQAALVMSRQEMAAKLLSTNQTLAQAAAQLAAAKAAGAQSFALAMLREAELTTAAAQAARSAILKQMAVLGAQQASVTAALTAATNAHTAAQVANTAALGAAGVASTLASRALGFLGGPIGATTTLLGLGATAWLLWGNAAKDSEVVATAAVERSTGEIITSLDKQIAKLKERNSLANAGLTDIAKQETEAAKKMATLQGQIDDVQKGRGIGANLPESARVGLLQSLLKQYGALAGKIGEVENQQALLNNAGEKTAKDKWLEKYATDAERLSAELAKARKELGSEFSPEVERRIRQKFKKPTRGAEKQKTAFDSERYLAGLSARVADEWEKINITETDEMRQNAARLAESSITADEAEKAKTLIQQNATAERQALMAKETDAYLAEMSRRYALEKEQKTAQEKGQSAAWGAIAGPTVDPVQRIREQMQLEIDAQDEYRARDLENAQLYEEAKQAIRDRGAAAIIAITKAEGQEKADAQAGSDNQSLGLMQSMADGAFMILEKSGKERTALGKTLFLASKALAIAEILINTEVAAAKAGAQLGIFGLPMAGLIRAQGYASAGMVAGMAVAQASGRQYGGPVSADGLYRVNEKGRPEMFTANNGNQYMMPTANGRVTAADNVGGGVAWSIVVNNNAPGATASASVDQASRTVNIAVNEVASQIRTNTGPVWGALRSATNTTSRL